MQVNRGDGFGSVIDSALKRPYMDRIAAAIETEIDGSFSAADIVSGLPELPQGVSYSEDDLVKIFAQAASRGVVIGDGSPEALRNEARQFRKAGPVGWMTNKINQWTAPGAQQYQSQQAEAKQKQLNDQLALLESFVKTMRQNPLTAPGIMSRKMPSVIQQLTAITSKWPNAQGNQGAASQPAAGAQPSAPASAASPEPFYGGSAPAAAPAAAPAPPAAESYYGAAAAARAKRVVEALGLGGQYSAHELLKELVRKLEKDPDPKRRSELANHILSIISEENEELDEMKPEMEHGHAEPEMEHELPVI